jgi:hypothetical protein
MAVEDDDRGRRWGRVCVGRATALAFAREGALVVGCDLTVEPAEATVELARGAEEVANVALFLASGETRTSPGSTSSSMAG